MIQHVLQSLHGIMIESLIMWIVHAVIKSIRRIIDVELGIDRTVMRKRKKGASTMGKSTMNLENICTMTIDTAGSSVRPTDVIAKESL